MRDLAERVTRIQPLQTAAYWVQYLVVSGVLIFPLTVYEGYFREHAYGMATQTFGPWLWDQAKALLVSLVLGGILVVLLFGVVRRLPRSWPVWGSVVAVSFMAFSSLIAPVYIVPIFNDVSRVDDPRIAGPILNLARANGIPAHDL